MIFDLFIKRKIYYIRLFVDKIEVLDVRNDRKISRKTTLPYASDRLIIADFWAAEKEMKGVMKEFNTSIINFSSIIVFQPIHDNIKEYSHTELRSFRDSCQYVGAREVYMYFGEGELSARQVKEGLEKKIFTP